MKAKQKYFDVSIYLENFQFRIKAKTKADAIKKGMAKIRTMSDRRLIDKGNTNAELW